MKVISLDKNKALKWSGDPEVKIARLWVNIWWAIAKVILCIKKKKYH